MNPDIYQETDLWNIGITDRLFNRCVVDGNASASFFFLLALLRFKQDELLKITSSGDLRDHMLSLPWTLTDPEIDRLAYEINEFVVKTPASTLYAIHGVYSQCSPGLLPPTVSSSGDVMYSRMMDFYE